MVLRANELAASEPLEMAGALHQLSRDPELLGEHMESLSLASLRKFGSVHVPLATARAKIEECESLADAAAWLDKSELRAVLSHPTLLRKILEM